MSFSANVKRELCGHENKSRHCDIAEIAGFINTCGEASLRAGRLGVVIQTENPAVAKKYFKLIKKTFQTNCDVSIKRSAQFKRSRLYTVTASDQTACERILLATGLMTVESSEFRLMRSVNPMVVKSTCCKRAYLRGAFVSGGSQSDPEKSYHLEFINTNEALSRSLLEIIGFFGLKAKMILRKGYYVVYLKEGESIVDLLNILGAHVSLMDLENVRIIKNVRNNVNRAVNCETANLSKTVDASARQVEDINFIFESKGMDSLSKQLKDVALVRLQYPEASLKELGVMLSPKVGKSGVNHRLRKISVIADHLRGGQL